jgi:hypothetical protein
MYELVWSNRIRENAYNGGTGIYKCICTLMYVCLHSDMFIHKCMCKHIYMLVYMYMYMYEHVWSNRIRENTYYGGNTGTRTHVYYLYVFFSRRWSDNIYIHL